MTPQEHAETIDLARRLVAQFEGCRLKAYQDAAGVWTCGYGATGKDITAAAVWTQDEADKRLTIDLEHARSAAMLHIAVPVSPRQLAALTSFVYNVGETAFRNSTLLTRLNQKSLEEAAEEFPRWCWGGGQKIKGLLRRRMLEAALFLEGS